MSPVKQLSVFIVFRWSKYSQNWLNKYRWLWKESLNNYGNQFHQYQQNEQLHRNVTDVTEDEKTYDVGNPRPGLGQAHKNMAGWKRLMGSQPSSLDNWISNGNTYKNKRERKTFTVAFIWVYVHTLLN